MRRIGEDRRWGSASDAAARVHPGLVRRGNEDAACADARLSLALVADGLGGHQQGEIASRVAIETTVRSFGRRGGVAPTTATTARRLRSAIEDADLEVRAQPGAIDAPPMGTTLVALAQGAGYVVVAHVGDSRCYRLRGDELSRLTRDHDEHPLVGRRLTRCLGGGCALEVEVLTSDARSGDVYVLCSDGLWEAVPDADVRDIAASARDAADACERLIHAACRAGGHDNIGVAVVRVE